MQDSIAAPRDPQPAPRAASGPIEAHPIRFTGDGGVYFGVWIVNVLLTIITLGLYTPWARRRTVRYFYGHTDVAGQPLEFTAGIRSMVVGFLLFAGLYIATEVAANMGQDWVFGVVMIAGALLSPWLWASAMRFRLGHTRWRGLRLRFAAPWAKVYGASWPLFVIVALWLVAGLALSEMFDSARERERLEAAAVDAALEQQAEQALAMEKAEAAEDARSTEDASRDGNAPQTDTAQATETETETETEVEADVADAADEEARADEDPDDSAEGEDLNPLPRPTWGMGAVVLATALLSFLCLIRLDFNYQRLLVSHTRIGGQWGRWKPVFGDFVRIWLATMGVFALSLLTLIVVVAGLLALAGVAGVVGALLTERGGGYAMMMVYLLLFMAALVALFVGSSPALAYREARMFQLKWNNIGVGQIARFRSDLRPLAFIWLRIKNMLLNLITLGFYRPFARVAEYQMKAQSVTLHLKGDLDQLVGQLEAQEKDGFGDAVADAMGMDLIG